jgi:hypothetical protein
VQDYNNDFQMKFRPVKPRLSQALHAADGMKKIADAKVEIEALNRKLPRPGLKKRLDDTNRACDIFLKEIGTRTMEATDKKTITIKKG